LSAIFLRKVTPDNIGIPRFERSKKLKKKNRPKIGISLVEPRISKSEGADHERMRKCYARWRRGVSLTRDPI
jgi:hypothetical protein